MNINTKTPQKFVLPFAIYGILWIVAVLGYWLTSDLKLHHNHYYYSFDFATIFLLLCPIVTLLLSFYLTPRLPSKQRTFAIILFICTPMVLFAVTGLIGDLLYSDSLSLLLLPIAALPSTTAAVVGFFGLSKAKPQNRLAQLTTKATFWCVLLTGFTALSTLTPFGMDVFMGTTFSNPLMVLLNNFLYSDLTPYIEWPVWYILNLSTYIVYGLIIDTALHFIKKARRT